MKITEFLEARIAEDSAAASIRTLAECEAKREIAEMHGPCEDKGWVNGASHDFLWCSSCGSIDDSPVPFPCETYKAITAVYKDHPDYQQEWGL